MQENKSLLLERLKTLDPFINPSRESSTKSISPEEYRQKRSLEYDLRTSEAIGEKVLVASYAAALYGTLCNNTFLKEGKEPWSGSWRYVGDLVSGLVTGSGDYMEYYASGNEGKVDPEVQEDLLNLGWVVEQS